MKPAQWVVAGLFLALLVLAGFAAVMFLAQRPTLNQPPPTLVVRAQYPGATPEVLEDVVALPIEQQVNGVEGLESMSGQTNAGYWTLRLTFRPGTDLELAKQSVQQRVTAALPMLPEIVVQQGVTVEIPTASPSLQNSPQTAPQATALATSGSTP